MKDYTILNKICEDSIEDFLRFHRKNPLYFLNERELHWYFSSEITPLLNKIANLSQEITDNKQKWNETWVHNEFSIKSVKNFDKKSKKLPSKIEGEQRIDFLILDPFEFHNFNQPLIGFEFKSMHWGINSKKHSLLEDIKKLKSVSSLKWGYIICLNCFNDLPLITKKNKHKELTKRINDFLKNIWKELKYIRRDLKFKIIIQNIDFNTLNKYEQIKINFITKEKNKLSYKIKRL